MRISMLLFFALIISGCSVFDRGIRIDLPKPTVDVCLNAISNDEMVVIKTKVNSETFSDEKLKRAKFHTRERCLSSAQVILLMNVFTFESDKLEMAKFLYTKTDDKYNYDVVVDELTYSGDKEELRNYMDSI